MEKQTEEKNGHQDSTDRKLAWIVKNPMWGIVLLLGALYYKKDLRNDELNRKSIDDRDKIIIYQDKLIDGFDRLNEQTENAEKRSRTKKDTVYVH